MHDPAEHHARTDLQLLVAAAKRRDPDAWEAIYRRAHPALFGFALRRLGDREAAEDAVSETMTRALAKIDDYEDLQPGVEAWLTGVLRNVVRETWRSTDRHRHPPTLPVPVAPSGPGEQQLLDEEALAVRRAFDALAADEQEVLDLRVVQGLSAEDVAHVQGRRAGAVRMAQHRALAHLRSLVDGGGNG